MNLGDHDWVDLASGCVIIAAVAEGSRGALRLADELKRERVQRHAVVPHHSTNVERQTTVNIWGDAHVRLHLTRPMLLQLCEVFDPDKSGAAT